MGFDTISDWTEFDNALAALRAQPGVFSSEEEKATVLGAVQGAIAHEQDAAKKLKMAKDVAGLIQTGLTGGAGAVLAALKGYFPWLDKLV